MFQELHRSFYKRDPCFDSLLATRKDHGRVFKGSRFMRALHDPTP